MKILTSKCGTLSLNAPVEKLEFGENIEQKLKNANVNTIEDLTTKCACEVLEIHGIGWLSLEHIIDHLQDVELSLNSNCRINRK